MALIIPNRRARRSSGVMSVIQAEATDTLAPVSPAKARPSISIHSCGANAMTR